MQRHIGLTLLLSFGMIGLGQTQTLINLAPGATITASSVYNDLVADFGTQKLVDGIFGPNGSGYDYNQWLAKGVNDIVVGTPGTLPAWLIFDLKASYSLSAVSLFNTKNATYNDTGSKDFDIQLSSDGVTYTPSLISGRLAWQNSSFQEYQFTNPTSARYVKINLTSAVTPAADGATGGSLGDIMRVGLQEVKIMGIPEPSALSLLLVGLTGLVTLRRTRRAV